MGSKGKSGVRLVSSYHTDDLWLEIFKLRAFELRRQAMLANPHAKTALEDSMAASSPLSELSSVASPRVSRAQVELPRTVTIANSVPSFPVNTQMDLTSATTFRSSPPVQLARQLLTNTFGSVKSFLPGLGRKPA